jgi:hypothetical protein
MVTSSSDLPNLEYIAPTHSALWPEINCWIMVERKKKFKKLIQEETEEMRVKIEREGQQRN